MKRIDLALSALCAVVLGLALACGPSQDHDAPATAPPADQGVQAEPAATPPVAREEPAEELTDEEAQKQTISDMQKTGAAMHKWFTAQVGLVASARPHPTSVDLLEYRTISRSDLTKILVPMYLPEVPASDGWGSGYEYYLDTAHLDAPKIMGIRSLGRDGRSTGLTYNLEWFDRESYDEDIVWADGFFVRSPTKAK